MQLTLRKAHKLVQDLDSFRGVKTQNDRVHRTTSEDIVKERLRALQAKNASAVETALFVQEAITHIREKLQLANATAVENVGSVNSLLTEKVLIESKMKVLASFSNIDKIETQEKIDQTLLTEVKDQFESTSEYRNSYIGISGFSEVDSKKYNKLFVELKRQQESVTDKLAYINNLMKVNIDERFNDLFTALQVL